MDKKLKFNKKILLTITITLNILMGMIVFLKHWTINQLLPLRIDGEFMTESTNRTKMYDLMDFEYLISKPKCSRDSSSAPFFVTLVNTSPTQFERRAACRDTWAHSDSRTKTYFLLGMVQSASLQRRIEAEEAQHHDIIQGNFFDSYHNLTYKHTMAMKWFTENCPNVKYMVKLDDDVFVNVPAVYEFLINNLNDKKFIMGIYFAPHPTGRNGKWKISLEEDRDRFSPEYCSGQSAIYSYDFAKDAYERTKRVKKYFWIDDMLITGFIRMQMNVRIEPLHSRRLSGDALKMLLNGTETVLPKPMFLFSEHDRKYGEMVKLWNLTERYRMQHQHISDFILEMFVCMGNHHTFVCSII